MTIIVCCRDCLDCANGVLERGGFPLDRQVMTRLLVPVCWVEVVRMGRTISWLHVDTSKNSNPMLREL